MDGSCAGSRSCDGISWLGLWRNLPNKTFSCANNGLPCIEACSCSDQCANSITDLEDEDDDDGDEERKDE